MQSDGLRWRTRRNAHFLIYIVPLLPEKSRIRHVPDRARIYDALREC